jgi:hypothetical protein
MSSVPAVKNKIKDIVTKYSKSSDIIGLLKDIDGAFY